MQPENFSNHVVAESDFIKEWKYPVRVVDYLRFQQPTSAGFLPATNVEPPDGCHGKGKVLPPLDTPRRDIITVDTIETAQWSPIVSHSHGLDQPSLFHIIRGLGQAKSGNRVANLFFFFVAARV